MTERRGWMFHLVTRSIPELRKIMCYSWDITDIQAEREGHAALRLERLTGAKSVVAPWDDCRQIPRVQLPDYLRANLADLRRERAEQSRASRATRFIALQSLRGLSPQEAIARARALLASIPA